MQPRWGQTQSHLLLLIVDAGSIKPNPLIATFESCTAGTERSLHTRLQLWSPTTMVSFINWWHRKYSFKMWGLLNCKKPHRSPLEVDCPIPCGNMEAHKEPHLNSNHVELTNTLLLRKMWVSLNPENDYFLNEKKNRMSIDLKESAHKGPLFPISSSLIQMTFFS